MREIPLFITIDTEGDALWDNPKEIRTENVLSIPRFQVLCEKYGLIPIWLTDFEIIEDSRYVDYIKPKAEGGLCEVGIHVHARNNPPIVKLDGEQEDGAAFLLEYPPEIMRKKFQFLKNRIEERIGMPVKTHRAGRWALNEEYIKILEETGIKYDCSVTPGIDWSNTYGIVMTNRGTDYSKHRNERHVLADNVVEYPVSIVREKKLVMPDRLEAKAVLKAAYHRYKRASLWLRPNTDGNLNEMKYVLDSVKNTAGYAEFMIHSSELMPGGGPHHQGKEEVDRLFKIVESLFAYAVSNGYVGHTFDSWENQIHAGDNI